MTVLGIETSCDETAIAVLDIKDMEHVSVRANVVSSQIALHAKFGGVVPNLAAREHANNIGHVLEAALKEAKISDIGKKVDLIAVTRGPGLGPALLVGIAFAKALAWKYDKPLVGADHMRAHVYSNWLPDSAGKLISLQASKRFPILNLIVSGGHTELVLMDGYENFKLIGETMDDAVGEAFDKVARLLGLGYPGGPAISRRAEKWKSEARLRPELRPRGNPKFKIKFPRPMEKSKNYNFSFSGLKTAVLYKIQDLKEAGIEITDDIKDQLCFEFQRSAVDVLVQKTIRAAQEHGAKTILLSGGVSANSLLRTELSKAAADSGLAYGQPLLTYTGDNAAMIGLAGYAAQKYGKADTDWQSVDMDANLFIATSN